MTAAAEPRRVEGTCRYCLHSMANHDATGCKTRIGYGADYAQSRQCACTEAVES